MTNFFDRFKPKKMIEEELAKKRERPISVGDISINNNNNNNNKNNIIPEKEFDPLRKKALVLTEINQVIKRHDLLAKEFIEIFASVVATRLRFLDTDNMTKVYLLRTFVGQLNFVFSKILNMTPQQMVNDNKKELGEELYNEVMDRMLGKEEQKQENGKQHEQEQEQSTATTTTTTTEQKNCNSKSD